MLAGRFVLALVLLSSAAHCSAAASELASPSMPARALTLVWYDGYRLAPHGFKLMAGEVTSVFDRLGVRIHWKEAEAGPIPGRGTSPDPTEIMVILLPSEPAGWGLAEDVMGAVLGEEVPRRAIYLFFPAVARTLGYRPKNAPAMQPKWIRDLGRSLGRVVAHELVHAVAPERPHTADGLMGGALKRRHLLRPDAALDPESASAFVADLDRAVLGRESAAILSSTAGWATESGGAGTERRGALLKGSLVQLR